MTLHRTLLGTRHVHNSSRSVDDVELSTATVSFASGGVDTCAQRRAVPRALYAGATTPSPQSTALITTTTSDLTPTVNDKLGGQRKATT
jgi:hypothetical protein